MEKVMELETIQYHNGKGWTVNLFPKLDSENTLIMVFGAPEFAKHQEPIKELKAQYPKSKMIGCSSSGEIVGTTICDHSLSVAIIRFDHTKIKLSKVGSHTADKSYEVGKTIANELIDDELKSIFVLSNGIEVNGSDLVKGISEIIADRAIVTGGLAGDGKDFKQTWIICDGEIYHNSVVAIGFYGNHLTIGHASRGGWDMFGPERRITRSQGNVLFELDDKPALDLYKEYLGERASGLPATGLLFPLSIRENNNDIRQLVRTISSVNETDKSLTFVGDIPEGYFAQLMRANFDRIISSASEAGQVALQIITDKSHINTAPVLSVAISCVGRRLVLGQRTEEEIEGILGVLPVGSKQIGFYSYGELSPYATGKCDLHNQTMTLTLFSEQ